MRRNLASASPLPIFRPNYFAIACRSACWKSDVTLGWLDFIWMNISAATSSSGSAQS
jgi:hypothetical protein